MYSVPGYRAVLTAIVFSRIVNLAVGVFMVLGGISQLFPLSALGVYDHPPPPLPSPFTSSVSAIA